MFYRLLSYTLESVIPSEYKLDVILNVNSNPIGSKLVQDFIYESYEKLDSM